MKDSLRLKMVLHTLAFCATSSVASTAMAQTAQCQLLRNEGHGWSVYVGAKGAYCLSTDLSQSVSPSFLQLPHQPSPNSPLMVISASDVVVDFRGHQLQVKQQDGQGLIVNGRGERMLRSIRVHHGTIRTTNRPAVFMVYAWNSGNGRFRERAIAPTLAIAQDVSDYRQTGFVLEDMTFEAQDATLIMQGRGNTIRRCKIIGGNATVNLYGPDLVFEDNEIVLTATDAAAGGEEPVALYLEDADGAMVRNNRITIRGRTADAKAIVLKNSSGVDLQNNSVNGAGQSYQFLDRHSSVR